MHTKERGPRKGASAFQGLNMEFRQSCGEFRAAGEEGVIEGYVTKWGTIDDYNSTFERGCFAKTLKERGARVKVLWNHLENELIGKPLELREDDIGLFARLKLVLPVQRGMEAYELAKAEALDSFSFGFRSIKDAWVDGVRRIKEVALYEVSPVVFEANENALITGVRSMHNVPNEYRAEDFAQTYADMDLARRHYLLMNVLDETLSDIWWKEGSPDMAKAKVADCLAKFSAAYTQYAEELTATWTNEMRATPEANELTRAVRETLIAGDNSPERIAATTSLTLDEVRGLLRGGVGIAQSKLAELPEEVRKAYARRRAEAMEQVCSELRAGMAPAERTRLAGLLGIAPDEPAAPEPGIDGVEEWLTKFRASLHA